MTTNCPICDAELIVEIDPGEPRVTSGPPERWYPGSPPSLDQIIGCDCYGMLSRGYPILDEDGEVIEHSFTLADYENFFLEMEPPEPEYDHEDYHDYT